MSEKPTEGNWFLIMVSWEAGADAEAIQRFYDVYDYLLPLAPANVIPEEIRDRVKADPIQSPDDPRLGLVPASLKSLNLIGRRKFVIIGQTTSNNSNRVLQALSRKISLGAPISVEIFPATNVHDLIGILPPEKQPDLRSK
jgi:hypothetical protein